MNKEKKINSYKYVIAIKIKDKTSLKINKVLEKLLLKFNVKFHYKKSSGPHITLTNSFTINNYVNIKKVHNEMERNILKPFNLKFKNTSIFFEKTPIHVVRWLHNDKIINLKNSVEKSLVKLQRKNLINNFKINIEFIAKCTLAHHDTSFENLKPISRFIKNTRFPNQCIVDNICLYKFIPFKEEKSVFEIKFN